MSKKERNLHLELTTELYRCFDFFNNHYLNGELKLPVINISKDPKRKCFGWFDPDGWTHNEEQKVEINLLHSTFEHSLDHVMDTLLHEMAHYCNYVRNDNKVVDCTDQQRHNTIFKTMAENMGLIVTSSKRFGFGHTHLHEDTKKLIASKLKPKSDLFKLYAEWHKKEEKKDKKKPDLKPTMVSGATKELIDKLSTDLGIDKKVVVEQAVNLLATVPLLVDTLTGEIFGKKFKTKEDLTKVITNVFTQRGEKVNS